jgi:hypothetical protein
MGGGKGWRVGLMLAALWALPCPSPADGLCFESLCLPHAAPWQRGPAEREQADDVYLLVLPADQAAASQVVLPRRAPVIKGDADGYFDRLTRYWRASYGGAVLIDWLEIGGVRWRYVRRPAREDGRGVFHLSTVFQGRAYSLLVFVPGTATTLPEAAMNLVAGIRFGLPPAGGDASATPAAPRWTRVRTYRLKLSDADLEAVAVDVARSGREGMLTGYGLDYAESHVAWFLEGFEWRTEAGRPTRVPWATRGRLEVEAPAELGEASSWTLRLSVPEGETGVSARLVSWELCGGDEALKAGLDRLDGGERLPMERLAEGCPRPVAIGPSGTLRGEAGKTVSATWTLPSATALSAPGARTRLVEAVLEPASDRTLPGDGLLRRARLFFAYEPR